jgi:hypothetical protein
MRGWSAAPVLAAAAVAATVAVFHLMPMDMIPRLIRKEALDAAHYIGFASLTILVMRWSLRGPQAGSPGSGHALFFAPLFLITLAVTAEFAQAMVPGRTPGLDDLVRDFIGIGAGILFVAATHTRMRSLRAVLVVAAAALLGAGLFDSGIALAGKFAARSQFPSIATFESDHERHLYRRMSSAIEVVAGSGDWSDSGSVLHVRPRSRAPYRGVSFVDFPQDWSGMETLAFTAGSAPGGAISITVRVYDDDSIEDYFDQFNAVYEIDERPRRIEIPLTDIADGPSLRQLDTARIREVTIFTDAMTDFFLDDLRLQ